jgi:hypothetical protein
MILHWPWSLLGGLAVAVAAALALRGGRRRRTVVASVTLWEQLCGPFAQAGLRRQRRWTVSWLLLAMGAAVMVVALARPAVVASPPGRRVLLDVARTVELAGSEGAQSLADEAERLLAAMEPVADVSLRYPVEIDQPPAAGLSPREAVSRLRRVSPIALQANDVSFAPRPGRGEVVIRLGAAGLTAAGADRVIALASRPRETVIDALAVEPAGGSEARMLTGIRHRGRGRPARLEWIAWTGADAEPIRRQLGAMDLPPDGRIVVERSVRQADAYAMVVRDTSERPIAAAFLARTGRPLWRVALAGEDEPLLRRFVGSDVQLELMAEPEEAEVIIARQTAVEPNRPALLIDPPGAPAGWRTGEAAGPILLADADLAADHPLLEGVGLAPIAIRRARPWVSGDRSDLQKVATLDGDALMLARKRPGPRRVWMAFDLAPDNTNLAVRPAGVILLANAIRWLAPRDDARDDYRALEPLSAPASSIKPVLSDPACDWAAGLPGPGIYREADGTLLAVSAPATPFDALPAEPENAASVPGPARVQPTPTELWPWLAGAALLLWLGGWALRSR